MYSPFYLSNLDRIRLFGTFSIVRIVVFFDSVECRKAMYHKSKDLTLVLAFDTLEHFRCFSGYGRTRAYGDDFRHSLSADAKSYARGDTRGRLRRLFRGPYDRRLSAVRLRHPMERHDLPVQRRPHHRPDGGYGSRWYDRAGTIWVQKFQWISMGTSFVPGMRRPTEM